MKSSAIVRIIIFSLVFLILLALLTAGIIAGNFFFGSPVVADGKIESVGSVSANEIRELDIEWIAGSVTIQAGDTDQITFSENSGLDRDDQLTWKQSGDTLQIKFCSDRVFLGMNIGFSGKIAKDLVITVPKDWICEELSIESVSAEITVTDLTAEKFDLDTVSGELDYRGSLQWADLDMVSGDCKLNLALGTKEIEIDSVSADLILYFPEEQGYDADIDCISGEVRSEFGGDSYGDGSCRISGDCVSGNIVIKKAA